MQLRMKSTGPFLRIMRPAFCQELHLAPVRTVLSARRTLVKKRTSSFSDSRGHNYLRIPRYAYPTSPRCPFIFAEFLFSFFSAPRFRAGRIFFSRGLKEIAPRSFAKGKYIFLPLQTKNRRIIEVIFVTSFCDRVIRN